MSIPFARRSHLLFVLVTLATAGRLSAESASAETTPGRSWSRVESPAAVGWSAEGLRDARAFSETLDTAAVVIVQDGVIVDEWGPTGLPLMCHSVRKSLLSALYGPYVADGTIDLDRTLGDLGIDDNEPSLTGNEKLARIRDLLAARSGIYHPALYETKAMAAARPKRGSHAPGTFWYYNNWDFNASCTIFEKLTGRSVFEEFERRIAGPLGFEDFDRRRHTQYVIGDDSVHAAYPFELSTRDLARFGLLFLRDGRWNGEQLVPAAWVRESTASYSDAGTSGGYGYMWWVAAGGEHFPGVTLPEPAYSARGYRGQYLVVVPEYDLVVCHRVNSFQDGTAVSKADFGKLLGMILAARPRQPVQFAAEPEASVEGPRFDVLVLNGEVVDGTGKPRFRADVGIRNGRIVEVGELTNATADRVIDAKGRIVAPGFIDLHSHAESGLVSRDPARRSAPNLITQGITTVVVNQDGGGPLDLDRQRRTMRRLGTGLNVVQTLGHGTIRRAVMGDDHRRPATPDEIAEMQDLLRKALDGGAFGMSAGLEYVPGRWSTPREMEALAEVVAAVDGVSIVHERSSGSRPMWFLPSRDPADQPSMVDNLRELIAIAGASRCRTVATHIKARGTDYWGRSGEMNDLLRRAREAGLPMWADQYPYNTSGSDGRIVLLPSWAFEGAMSNGDATDYAAAIETVLADDERANDLRRDIGYEIDRRGGPESILIVEHADEAIAGKSLAEYATFKKLEPVEAAIDLQLNGDRARRGGARVRAFSMSEKDVEAFAATPWTATSSDAGIALPTDAPVHPRFYGAFPRKIRRYAIDRGLISIEEAVRVSTSLPASLLKLEDRGVVRAGAAADLVIFDPERIRDTADAFHPHRYAEGIDHVLVNGIVATDGPRWLGTLAGVVLERPGTTEVSQRDATNETNAPKTDDDTPELDLAPVIEKLRAAIRHEVESKSLPAFSLAVVDDQRVVFAEGFGSEDADGDRPATADTVYRVGSISKLFTDVAVLQLVEEGKLDLDAPITTYLPDFAPRNPYDRKLTLRQMMSHRSGLVRESPVGNYFDPEEPSLAATVASLNETALVYEPETKTKYSNAAIAVVGAVLEKSLDVSHPERVRRGILDPLGMTGSGFEVTAALKPHLATGWMRTYDGRRFVAPDFLLGTGPAGNMYASVNDLARFLTCLFRDGETTDGRLLKPESFALMTTPVTDAEGKPTDFGLGFHVGKLDGHTKVGHGGAVYGFSTQFEALPDRKLGIAAVASLDGTNGVVGRLGDYALRLMLAAKDGKPLPDYRTTGPVPPERAHELVGTYREVDGERFTTINELNGDLYMQRGVFRYELRAAADDGTTIVDDEIGFGTEVSLEGANRLVVGGTRFDRIPDAPPVAVPDRWRGLVGEYGWDHNTLYVLVEDGKLYVLIEWFYYYPLEELGDDLFAFPDYGLYHGEKLKFTRDAAGNGTKVVAAEVEFVRREVGTKDGETFKITPVKPINELRAGALAAQPPPEPGDFREADLVELTSLDETIDLDIRYATTNNFTGAVFYKQPRAFMQKPAAEAVARANARLRDRGLGLLVHDAYRPWFVTKMFWDATPDEMKDFVANPRNGSRHNRGCAVDLTLYDLKSGEPIPMVAGYDEFSPRSFPLYPGGTSRQRWYRDLLRRTMEAEDFTIYEFEWWHFDFRDWKKYRIGNRTFEQVLGDE